MFQALLSINDDFEEEALQKLLQTVMKKVFATYSLDDPSLQPSALQPVPLEDDPYASFPNYPRVRQPRKYQADRPWGRNEQGEEEDVEVSPEELCRKFADSHASLNPGILFTKNLAMIML